MIDCGILEEVLGVEDFIFIDIFYVSSFNFSCKIGLVRSGVLVSGDYIVIC